MLLTPEDRVLGGGGKYRSENADKMITTKCHVGHTCMRTEQGSDVTRLMRMDWREGGHITRPL